MSSASCSKRGGKAKVPVPATAALFALGANDQSTSIGQKRGAQIPSKDNLLSVKKAKIAKPPSGEWEDNVIDVENELLLKSIVDAENSNDESKIDRLLCGAARKLRSNRVKTDSILILALSYLAKSRPHLFQTDNVIVAFCSILKKESTLSAIKPKSADLQSILAANILWATHRNEPNWPLTFVEAYIEDSLGARVWVDHDACKPFVLNILTAFNTKIPPKNLMSQDILTAGANKNANDSPASASPPHPIEDPTDETSSSSLLTTEIKDKLADVEETPRYTHIHQTVVDYTIEKICEGSSRRLASTDINRNVLKLLMATVGIPQVRVLVAQKIEAWLQNPKLSRPAQDLLLTVCINCTKEDIDVINSLVRMRLKTKPLMNHFMICIKELLGQSDDNLVIVMKNAMSNEFSQARGLNNMQLLSTMFQFSSSKATKYLASLIHEFLAKEDCLRQVRILLREIVRTLRHDHINMTKVVAALTENNSCFSRIESPEVLIRIMLSIADLIPLCMFVIISPSVKESLSKPEKKDVLRSTQSQIAEIQRLAIIWMQKVVMKVFRPERSDFMPCLNKVLIMERAEHYYEKDNWPPESDRHLLFRITTEVPLHEDSLIRILKMGLSKDYPLQSSEAIELSDALIKRAAATYDGDASFSTLSLKKEEIFNLLLKSAIYKIPENITLPSGYEPPSVAITDCYWKVWVQLLIITAYNSQKFGTIAWETYPTLALFIEMCITNQFDFPPATRQHEDLKANELQIAAIERSQILQFESHLAASSKRQITEANSLLLSKVITFDPTGKPRHPPTGLLEDLKNHNNHLKLGYWLCQSRNPDFLLEIIERQQNQTMDIQSSFNLELGPMQWLNDLIEMNTENFSSLPVQGLCEFTLRFINEEKQLIGTFNELKQNEKNKRKEKRKKFGKLLTFFHESLDIDPIVTRDVMDYFFKRLSSQQGSIRSLSAICVHLILDYDESMIDNIASHLTSYPETWLIGALPNIKNFESVKYIACYYLRSAIIVETNSEAICCYIQFLAEFSQPGNRKTLRELSRVIIDRATTFKYLTRKSNLFREDLLSSCIRIFSCSLDKIREEKEEDIIIPFMYHKEYVTVSWGDIENKSTLHILILQALMVLLTYDPPQIDTVVRQWEKLVNLWFSDPMPVCYLFKQEEEALLLADWLKLKLMRSSCPTLVDAALKDSDLPQLLLFIQSFGIPVSSMEKILQALDKACDADIDSVRNQVSDAHFLHQIVEVQFMRGVKAGKKFAKALGIEPDSASSKEAISDPFSLPVKAY